MDVQEHHDAEDALEAVRGTANELARMSNGAIYDQRALMLMAHDLTAAADALEAALMADGDGTEA